METIKSTNEASLRDSVDLLVKKMMAAVEARKPDIDQVYPSQRVSAANLIQYLALRGEDVRSLQDHLHVFGLSSLASSESHILRQAQAILERLGADFRPNEISSCDYYMGRG